MDKLPKAIEFECGIDLVVSHPANNKDLAITMLWEKVNELVGEINKLNDSKYSVRRGIGAGNG